MRRATFVTVSAGGLRASAVPHSSGLLFRSSTRFVLATSARADARVFPLRSYTTTAEEFVGKLMADLKEATMAKDKVRLGVIRRLRSEIMNKEKLNVDAKLEFGDCVKVVQQMAKQCEDSAKEFDKINQADTAAKEREEARLLRTYLPAQLSEAEVQQLAEEAVKAVGATTIKDMKNVMATLGPKVQGKSDPSLVGEIVRKLLGGK
ncbi:GatB/YqeY domain containing protein [Acanthamoeba castellanii str. Neff]|uniref:GatB/YqeY domain containing protein n=1 Tax=Acanthamoeba castellanii (strain ATCC 30010 / Neff) TaxID=1257118 RepID=L8H8T4_ACACF|nr:GatB/YqeY domain containing protein [Acanthamoeba castellanii str. Neff]ELR20881.1 GatB/YqeY domain containing protein [Acanthamoeba castellanii str. Neff]